MYQKRLLFLGYFERRKLKRKERNGSIQQMLRAVPALKVLTVKRKPTWGKQKVKDKLSLLCSFAQGCLVQNDRYMLIWSLCFSFLIYKMMTSQGYCEDSVNKTPRTVPREHSEFQRGMVVWRWLMSLLVRCSGRYLKLVRARWQCVL